jgi:hypothetical protein
MPLLDTMRRIWRGLCTNWIGTAGVVLTTSSFVLFSLFELLLLAGVITNAYVGLISYLALPTLFVIGLLLIPSGWWLFRRREKRSAAEALSQRFDAELVAPKGSGSRLFRTIAVLTVANIVFLGAAAARMLRFMDQPSFCGTACHSVMGPEWRTYQDSPHARVRCVDCHVGQGAEAAIDAKLNGLWQMISVTFDLYERPIPTPVHSLRPARETCERCHWPAAVYGDRIKRFVRFDQDRVSTKRYSTLSLKVGSGRGERRGEIHWHVAARNEVRYMPADASRATIRWVEVRQPDGSYRRYGNRKVTQFDNSAKMRVLDCVDCHNRATHIYQSPEQVVDRLLASGAIDRRLPFAKRQALGALTGSYREGDGLAGIDRDFRGYYRRYHRGILIAKSREIDRAVVALQAAYRRNIHPEMNVGWDAYPDHRGHRLGPGCRRCHSPDMVDSDGNAVPNECTLCHSILAYESARPFEFLQPAKASDRERRMGDYLRDEFLSQPRE